MSNPTQPAPGGWDAVSRALHWVLGLLVVLAILTGLLFMYRDGLHLVGKDAKMALKGLHSWISYPLVVALLLRGVWLFRGPPIARWRAVWPGLKAWRDVPSELRDLRDRRPVRYVVRSPVNRITAVMMYGMLLLLSLTGLVRAGTDLYHLPLGPVVAMFVARPDVPPSTITWRNEETTTIPYRFARVTQVKVATGWLHRVGSWVMLALVGLHVLGIVLTEIRQRSGMVSAMVSGGIRRPSPSASGPGDSS